MSTIEAGSGDASPTWSPGHGRSNGVSERCLAIDCHGEHLPAILHLPASSPSRFGVIVVVGGPQYRVGSHREFLLLARALAADGFPVLRFDYRGMGDAEGEARDFLAVDDDIRAAVDAMLEVLPALDGVVLWGLCDGASAAAYYAASDARVRGLVLLNPWVRSEAGIARAYLKHYYLQRLVSADFWRKLLSGGVNPMVSLKSLADNLRSSLRGTTGNVPPTDATPGGPTSAPAAPTAPSVATGSDLATRMAQALAAFDGDVLLILSGRDLTAQEFAEAAGTHRGLKRALRRSRLTRHAMTEADHTFSRTVWRDEVARRATDWLGRL